MGRRPAFFKTTASFLVFVAHRAILGGLLLCYQPAIAMPEVSDAGKILYPGQLFLHEYEPGTFEVADFNADESPDVVILGPWTATDDFTAQVFLNNGAAGFIAVDPFVFPGIGRAITVADVNGDGASDILIEHFQSGEEIVSVLIADGDGNFHVHGSHVLGSGGSRKLAVGDINGDGADDIAWINRSTSGGSVLFSDGDGGFASRQIFETADEPIDLEIADINEDGWQDVILADDDPTVFGILMNDGTGVLVDVVEKTVEYPVDGIVVDLETGDVTGDGHTDIAITGSEGDFRIHAGTGSGDFLYCWGVNTSSEMTSITMADVSGDGKAEVIAAADLWIETWFGDAAAGEVMREDHHQFGGDACNFYRGLRLRGGARKIVVSDITGDGAPDFVTQGVDSLHIVASNGSSYSTRKELSFGGRSSDVDLVDVTGDGKLDIIASNFEPGLVWVLPGDGAGSVTSKDWYDPGDFPMDVDAADVTGDGFADLVVANGNGDSISVLRGTGSGKFYPAEEFPAGDKPWVLEIADITGDGWLDVLTGNFDSHTVSLLENDHSGGFLAAREFAVNREPRVLIVADVSGDESLDVIVGPDVATILTGDGEGGFLPAVDHAAPGCEIFVTDLTGDNVNDVVCADSDGIRVVDIGEDGRTATSTPDPREEARRGFSLVDVNGDGWLDVLSVDTYSHAAVVRLGNGAGGYLRELHFATEAYPYDLALGDMTGDGKPDIVTIHNRPSETAGFTGAALLPQFNPAPTADSIEIRIDNDGLAHGTLSARDPENEILTYSVIDRPDRGILSFSDSSNRVFTYSANYDYVESDIFTFVGYDGTGSSNVAIVKMYRNRPPVALDSTIEVEIGGIAFGNMNASDPDGDEMTFSIVTKPTHGIATVIDPATGAFSFETHVDSDDEFTFEVTDGGSKSNIATVRISILPEEVEHVPGSEGEGGGEEPDPIPPRLPESQGGDSQGGGAFGMVGLLILAIASRRRLGLNIESRKSYRG